MVREVRLARQERGQSVTAEFGINGKGESPRPALSHKSNLGAGNARGKPINWLASFC